MKTKNPKATEATSSDVPAGGGSTAGAAPALKIEAYVPNEHTLEENILHAGEIADRLDRLVIDNQPHSVLILETSALSIALRGIASRFAVEVSSQESSRLQSRFATPGVSILSPQADVASFIDGEKITVVLDDGPPLNATMHIFAGAAPSVTIDDGGSVKIIHLRPEGRVIPPAPDPAAFEAAMAAERESQASYFSNLLDTIGPKLIAFARQVKQESAAAVDAEQLQAAIRAELAKVIPPATEVQVVRLEPEVREFIRAVVLEVAGKTDTPPAPAAAANLLAGDVVPAGTIKQGSKVKVWTDAAKRTFIGGTVEEVHDAGHSFDVELENGSVAHVQADNLALDELAK